MPMRKLILNLILLILFYLVLSALDISALVLPRFRKSAGTVKKGVASGVIVTPRLRNDRKALNVYFNNLSKAKNVNYTFIYQTNGKDEGVSGSIDSSVGNSTMRELLFGTCSAGVCRYHTNIANMKLEVVIELTSGKRFLKRFRIRV